MKFASLEVNELKFQYFKILKLRMLTSLGIQYPQENMMNFLQGNRIINASGSKQQAMSIQRKIT